MKVSYAFGWTLIIANAFVKNLLFDLYDVEHTQSLQNVAEDVVDALHNWEKTDKSELIDVVNGTLFTEHHFTRVTHSHRFCKC